MKRRLTKFVLFLLLGAVVNVAVAWGCAVRVDVFAGQESEAKTSGPNGQWWLVRRWSRPGATIVASARGYDSALDDNGDPATLAPHWSGLATARPEFQSGVATYESRVVDARGWPLLSMWSSSDEFYYELMDQIDFDTSGGIRTSQVWDSHGFPFPLYRVLPLRAIWPGFAINTVFYAALLRMLWLSPFVVRRVIRHKRGHCIKCGYDLRHVEHEACPECGAER